MAHFIRLRGAWEVERREASAGSHSIRLARQFGCSSGLKAAARVVLSIADVAGRAVVELNGSPLGTIAGSQAAAEAGDRRCPARFEIARLLQSRNVLTIEILATDATGEAERPDDAGPGLVQLEID